MAGKLDTDKGTLFSCDAMLDFGVGFGKGMDVDRQCVATGMVEPDSERIPRRLSKIPLCGAAGSSILIILGRATLHTGCTGTIDLFIYQRIGRFVNMLW
jgi:hypothetical protein